MKGLPKQAVSLQVVGLTYRPGYPDTLLRLNQMMGKAKRIPVQFRREVDNPHDPNAVAVLIDGVHLGYLQKAMAKRASHDLQNGVKRKAWVEGVKIHPDHLDHPGLWVLLEDVSVA